MIFTLLSMLVGACLCIGAGRTQPDAEPPNIILILADDLGWCDVERGPANPMYGSDVYETPAITALAAAGTVFTNAYSAGANCSPTRAAILSGQYAPRHHVYTVGTLNRGNRTDGRVTSSLTGVVDRDDLRPDIVTIAERLQAAGYSTAHVGKYHVGGHEGGEATLPLNQGFDVNIGGTSAGHPTRYIASSKATYGRTVGAELDAFAEPGEHLTDAVTDAALDFIDKHTQRPFFLHLAHFAVHTPIRKQGRRDLVEYYDRKIGSSPGTMGHDNADYAALVHGLDMSVARVIEHLHTTPGRDGRPLIETTWIIFTSDNGALTRPAGRTTNGPFRGQKGEYWDGGVRVPLLIAGPRAGQRSCEAPATSVDLYPTFLDIAGLSPDTGHTLDGASLLPIAQGHVDDLDRDAIYWHFPGYLVGNGRDCRPVTAVRSGRWKLLHFYEDGHDELYDLDTDPGEQVDRAADSQAERERLRALIRGWMQSCGAEVPLVTVP